MKLMLLLKHFQMTSPAHPDSTDNLCLSLPVNDFYEAFLKANAVNAREGKTREINWPQTFARAADSLPNFGQGGNDFAHFNLIYQRELDNEIVYGFQRKEQLYASELADFELTQSGDPDATLQGDVITRAVTRSLYSAKQLAMMVIPVSLLGGQSNCVPREFFNMKHSCSLAFLHAAHALIPKGHRVREFQEKYIAPYDPKKSVYQYDLHLGG